MSRLFNLEVPPAPAPPEMVLQTAGLLSVLDRQERIEAKLARLERALKGAGVGAWKDLA